MTKTEQKLLDFLSKNIPAIIIVAATLAGMLLRICGWNFESDDFKSFLQPWWGQISSGGLQGLSKQVGNYNIPYQIITFLLTLLPLKALHAYKLLSVVFDLVLAASASLLVYEVKGRKNLFAPALTFAAVFCAFTVMLNSAFWAQCDSIYVSFILLAIYFAMRDRQILCFVMLGISFAFKLQMVFILPLFLYYYVSARKCSLLHFLIIPAVDIVMCLPAVLLGRNFTEIFTIYPEQTDYGKLIQMNCPNFYAFICNGYDMNYYHLFKGMSIFLTAAVLLLGACVVLYKHVDLKKPETLLLTGVWTCFTCLMFLSSMHERYGYLLDILLILYVVLTKKHFLAAVACHLVSLRGYAYYLFGNYEVLSLQWTAVIYIGLYLYFTRLFFKQCFAGQPEEKKPKLKKKS